MKELFGKTKVMLSDIKKDKKRLSIIAVAMVGIILIVISSSTEKDTEEQEQSETSSVQFSESEYTLQLEQKLSEMISALYGAGRTKVVVTLDCDYETVYARDGSFSKDEESSDEKSEYIIIDSSQEEGGLVLKTVTPKVRGVAVLCEGGDDPYVEEQISEMLSALLNLGSNHISVSKIQ